MIKMKGGGGFNGFLDNVKKTAEMVSRGIPKGVPFANIE